MHKNFMETALAISKDAGDIMRKNFQLGMKKEWKEDGGKPSNFVTETDLAINDLVLKRIKELYPDHSILSEEGDDFCEGCEFVWICDPVDGTHNFSHGLPTASFALALLQNGEPILSVVLDPFLDRTFTAEKGKGAFLNGKQIHVNTQPVLKKALIGCGKTKQLRNLFPFMDAAYSEGVSFITGLSIHYFCALVAAGEFSAAIFGGKSAHDMAAAKILVEEAGGKVTDIWGKPTGKYDCGDMPGQICSNGLIHEQIVALLDKTVPQE